MRQPTVEVLDDTGTEITWNDEPLAPSERYWIEQYQEQLTTTQELRTDLSSARFQRDVWSGLAFCVGVLCGIGLTVLW